MTYLTFKYNYKAEGFGEDDFNNINTNRDFTLGYNHILNAFVAFYDFCPAIWHNHNDLVLSANNPKSTKTYESGMPSTSYVLGDTVKVDRVEYICISPLTISVYPGTSGQLPTATSSVYWKAINKENEIYLQTFGADLCKFYGKVFDHSLETIINFKTDIAVTPQNIQFKGNTTNWTDVYCSADNQSSQDLNISSTNRNYRWIDSAWFSSLPLDRLRGRITDYYVKINFIHKNYISDPTAAKNIQKLSQWLRTFFVSKR